MSFHVVLAFSWGQWARRQAELGAGWRGWSTQLLKPRFFIILAFVIVINYGFSYCIFNINGQPSCSSQGFYSSIFVKQYQSSSQTHQFWQRPKIWCFCQVSIGMGQIIIQHPFYCCVFWIQGGRKVDLGHRGAPPKPTATHHPVLKANAWYWPADAGFLENNQKYRLQHFE